MKTALTIKLVSLAAALSMIASCSDRNSPQPQNIASQYPELQSQGFSETEITQIVSLVEVLETNTATPAHPATEASDKKLADAGAALMRIGERVAPFLQSRQQKALETHNQDIELTYSVLLRVLKENSPPKGSGNPQTAPSVPSNSMTWQQLLDQKKQLRDAPFAKAYREITQLSKETHDDRKVVQQLRKSGNWSAPLLDAVEHTVDAMIAADYDGDTGMKLERELGDVIRKTAKPADSPVLMWMYSNLSLHVSGEFPSLVSLMDIMGTSNKAIREKFTESMKSDPKATLALLFAFMADSRWWGESEAQQIWELAAQSNDPVALTMYVENIMDIPDQIQGAINAEKVAPYFKRIDRDGVWLTKTTTYWRSFNAGVAVERRHLIDALEQNVKKLP